MQYRCAGFIQAEIESYAEEFDESAPSDDKSGHADESSESEDDDVSAVKGKKSKGKKLAKDDEVPST